MFVEPVVAGHYSSVQIDTVAGEVIKRAPIAFSTRTAAEQYEADLHTYGQALASGPLAVTPLSRTSIIESDQGFHVEHRYGVVDGPNLATLPFESAIPYIARIIGLIALMDTYEDGDTLVIPVDVKAGNFHIGPDGEPILVDIAPPLIRHADRSFPAERFPRYGTVHAHTMGTKVGAITQLLVSACGEHGPTISRLQRIMMSATSWSGRLPLDQLQPAQRRRLERGLRLHFAPYVGRVLLERMRDRIGLL